MKDIRVVTKTDPEISFVLNFYFSPNDYFSNEVLSKTYYIKCELDEEDIYGFEGPQIYKSAGTKILWKEGKDITKQFAEQENVNKFFPTSDSFFAFFDNPAEVPKYDGFTSDKLDVSKFMKILENFFN